MNPPNSNNDYQKLRRQGFEISLYDADHRVIATNVQPAVDGRASIDVWTSRQLVADDAGARIEAFVRKPFVRPRPPGNLFLALGILLAALVLLVITIARHLGRPLQKLASAAHRFGEGDLAARARIDRSDELGDIGRAFDEMADRVAALIAAQRELMVGISHELHTPLARIQVAVDLMLDGVDDHATDLLPKIAADLAELPRLIDDIMAISRFELAGGKNGGIVAPMKSEVTALVPVIEEASRRFRRHYPERVVELSLAELPQVTIDPVLIRRVLENLLDNAQKYSERDTSVTVSAKAGPDSVTISVRDRGIGIDSDDLRYVFTPFFRADRSRSRSTGGFGLGLSFAKRVLEAHGGSIEVASKLDDGTTVTLVLPLRA